MVAVALVLDVLAHGFLVVVKQQVFGPPRDRLVLLHFHRHLRLGVAGGLIAVVVVVVATAGEPQLFGDRDQVPMGGGGVGVDDQQLAHRRQQRPLQRLQGSGFGGQFGGQFRGDQLGGVCPAPRTTGHLGDGFIGASIGFQGWREARRVGFRRGGVGVGAGVPVRPPRDLRGCRDQGVAVVAGGVAGGRCRLFGRSAGDGRRQHGRAKDGYYRGLVVIGGWLVVSTAPSKGVTFSVTATRLLIRRGR